MWLPSVPVPAMNMHARTSRQTLLMACPRWCARLEQVRPCSCQARMLHRLLFVPYGAISFQSSPVPVPTGN